MLTTYAVEGATVSAREGMPGDPAMLRRAVWIDLFDPSAEEAQAVQAALRLEVPTREEMQEIEASSRFRREGGALFLTANLLHRTADDGHASTPIAFVLTDGQLVTVRHATPEAVPAFVARVVRDPALLASPDAAMLHLIEEMLNRLADVLRRAGTGMDETGRAVFREARAVSGRPPRAVRREAALKATLVALGRVGDVAGRATETLVGLPRILAFVGAEKRRVLRREDRALIETLVGDVRSLLEHADLLNGKAQFLLAAVLGIATVEQNRIFKIFTVATVALTPPTFIASLYGMNFERMPELHWKLGYPFALALMVLSAVLPLWYFHRRRWL